MTSCHVVPFYLIDSFDKTLDIKPPYKHIVISSSGPERKTGVQQKEKLNTPTPSLLGNRSEFFTMISVFFPSKTSQTLAYLGVNVLPIYVLLCSCTIESISVHQRWNVCKSSGALTFTWLLITIIHVYYMFLDLCIHLLFHQDTNHLPSNNMQLD